MKKSVLCILVAAFAMIAGATPVTSSQAKQAARAWAQKNAAFAGEDAIVASSSAVAVKNADGVTLWYRVAMKNGSCIVVSPVMELEPVVACLENVPKDGLPAGHPVRAMLERDMADRLKKLGLYTSASTGPTLMGATPAASQAAPADPAMAAWAEQGKAKWARLAGGTGGTQLMAAVTNGVDDAGMAEIVCVAKGFEKGGPLTHWNQEKDKLGKKCYNLYTPNNYPCGCVATAMAAMLQFFGANATKADLSPEGGVCTVDGVATNAVTMSGGGDLVPEGFEYYDWSLLDDMTSLSDYADDSKMNDDIRDLLGRVAYDAGVMLSMSWSAAGSGANTADIAKALKAFQKADIDSESSTGLRACAVMNPAESHYEKLIYFPCRLGKPVGLGINQVGEAVGHAVLAVGFGWDDECNARVRIFAGWGGTGDGWYSLPYIDTKSLPSQAGSFLFDVVNKVVTLIGYEDENRVPLVGRVGKPKKVDTLTLKPAGTSVTVSDKGYFGLCVASRPLDISLVGTNTNWNAPIRLSSSLVDLMGKDSLKPGELCAALPDEIFFEAMNCSVAYSFDKALEYARDGNKALLRVSGMMQEEATSNLVERIRAIDEEDATFKDKFVYFFTPANSSTDLADGNPSIGVFLPDDTEQSGRWRVENGRLAYGYGYSSVLDATTNAYAYAEASAEDDPDNYVENVTNQAYVASWGSEDTGTYVSTNLSFSVDGLLDAVQLVLGGGWDEFCRQTHGISLTVTSKAGEVGTPEPMYGMHENVYTNGQTITAIAPDGEVTNAEQTVVSKFAAWVLTVTNTVAGGAETLLDGTGKEATFSLASNDVATLEWLLEPKQVKINVVDSDDDGVTEPGSGWYPYGESVTFAATPNDPDNGFREWGLGNNSYWPDYIPGRDSPVLSFVALEPLNLTAYYGGGSSTESSATTNFLVRVVSVTADGDGLTDANLPDVVTLVVSGKDPVAMGGTIELPDVMLAMRVQSATFTDSNGKVWQCCGWTLEPDPDVADSEQTIQGGTTDTAGFKPEGAAVLTWVWEPAGTTRRPLVDPDDVPVAADGVSSPLTIYANPDGTFTVEATIGNAVEGWWYVLRTCDTLTGTYVPAQPEGAGDVCAALAEADGTLELRTTFVPTDEKRFYKVTVEEDEP